MKLAINYADDKFKKKQRYNTITAYKKGKVDRVIEYGPDDIDSDFEKKHLNILSQKRGGGYWLWKPYIILKTLNESSEGDYIIYCDSGAYYVDNVDKLITTMNMNKTDVMAFELPLIEKQWTKKETFKLMECDSDFFMNTNQFTATYMVIKNTPFSRKFINKYLDYCTDETILTDLKDENKQVECFIDHRHDQSIFSLLCKKEGITPFRDPSQYGDKPWDYANYYRYIFYKKYENSTYPRILMSYRKDSLLKFKIKEFMKDLLYSVKLVKSRL